MIIKAISLKALRKLVEFKKLFAHQKNQERPLIDFLDPVAARLLVDEQRRGGTLAGRHLTDGNVLESTDQEVTQLFVEYIRVRQASNRNKFTSVVLNSVTHLKSKTDNWNFGVRGYHLDLHSAMTKLLWEMGISLAHLYKGATNVETQYWPDMNYGRKEEYGVIKIIMTCLDRFAENYEQLIGLKILKGMKSAKELITKLGEVNDRQADAAMTLENQDAASALPMSLRKLQEDSGYRRKASEEMEKMAKEREHQSNRSQSFATPSRILQRSDGYRSDTTGNDRSRSKPLTYDRNQSQTTDSYCNRLNVLDEEEEMEYERSFLSDTTSGQPEAMHSRVVPAAANWAEIEEEEDDADQSNFLAELYQGHAPGAGTLFDPSAKKTPNPNTPCFAMFYDGECSGKCGRSHLA